MSQCAASQNTVRVNTSDRSGLTAVSDHNQLHPHDGSSPASSTRSSIHSYGSGTSSSPVEQEAVQNITEYKNAANPQRQRNQQPSFDGYGTGSSARSSIRSNGSVATCLPWEQETRNDISSPVEQEVMQIITEHDDQYTTITINQHEIDNGQQRSEYENPMLPSATPRTDFTRGVRVISERGGKLADNVSRLSAPSKSLMNRKCSIDKVKDVCVILFCTIFGCLFWSGVCYVFVMISLYLVYLTIFCVIVLQLFGLAASLVRFINASRDLYKRRHIVERLDLLKTCFSECALFFGVLIAIATMSILYLPLLMGY